MPNSSSFHDVRFPLDISRRATGGPQRKTEIVVLGSGREQRNARWADSRRRYDIGYGVKDIDDIHRVVAFFEARMGRLHGFRFRDWTDWKSCPPRQSPSALDQPIATADGQQTTFQLVKTYGSGPAAWLRQITRPVHDSVKLAIDGQPVTSGWSLDDATGSVTFDVPPAAGGHITAGYEFDVPVRFDTDALRISLSAFNAGAIPDIPLVEIRA